MAGFSDATEQAKQFWSTRSAGQKGFLLAGTGATVLLLTLFVRLIGTPDYKPLYTGLEAADAQTLSTQLDAEGIPHEASADGKTISVPADKLDAARLQTATQGAPHSGRMGFELFDKMSWGQTEFDEKVTYQRALEGELERTIQTLDDVDTARVHLVMPTDSVFDDHQRGAKASVILKLRHNGLSKDAVVAISRLVSGAVDQLKPEDVSIVDADSDRSLGLSHDDQVSGEGADATLTQSLISTLEPVVGADKIRASVNIDYDQGTTEESQEKYDPTVSAVLTEQKSEEKSGGGTTTTAGGTTTTPAAAAGLSGPGGGVPGTSSNVPTKQATKSADVTTQNPTQTSTSDSAQYGVNKVEIHSFTPAGRIQRITAAILVDDTVVRTVQNGKASFQRVKRSPEELDKIKQLAEAVIGFDEKRGDTISVQNLSFDSPLAAAEPAVPNWTEKVQKTVTDYSSLLRPVSLLVLFLLAYMFVLRPIQKQALGPGMAPQMAQPALAAGGRVDRLPLPVDMVDDTRRAAQLKEQTIELIKQKPVNTARAVQAWLREEPS
jgi:flagellar M-ring protein FliF